jgi:hypothetical protein
MNPTHLLLSLGTAAALALPSAIYSQTPGKAPTPVRASVGEVTDNRSTGSFFSECKVELKFTGDAANDAGSVRTVRVTEALDELGRDLKPEKTESGFPHSFSADRSGSSLKAEVKLKKPSRNAGTIKVIKGEVELFNPTESNGAILRIKDVLKHPAEPIQNATLTKNGIVLIYLTKESYEAKKKEVEAQQSAGANGAANKLGEAFGELFKGMFGGMMSDSKNAIQLYIKDPQNRVANVEFQDAQGKPLKNNGRWSSGEFQQTQLSAPPPADTQLVIQLAVPEAVKTFSFEVRDVPLP